MLGVRGVSTSGIKPGSRNQYSTRSEPQRERTTGPLTGMCVACTLRLAMTQHLETLPRQARIFPPSPGPRASLVLHSHVSFLHHYLELSNHLHPGPDWLDASTHPSTSRAHHPSPPSPLCHSSQWTSNDHVSKCVYLVHALEPKFHEGRAWACLSHHLLPSSQCVFPRLCPSVGEDSLSGDTKASQTPGYP